jgi:cytochrome c-type biogenesis protein CcmH
MFLLITLLLGAATLWGTEVAAADQGDDLINELRCPSAGYSQPLATANSREAMWMRTFIRAKVAEGWSKQRIVDTLVRQYGEGILPTPPKEGFSLAAWITPFATIFGGAAVMGYVLTGWLRKRKWHDAYLNAEMAREIDEADLQRYEAQLSRELEQFE